MDTYTLLKSKLEEKSSKIEGMTEDSTMKDLGIDSLDLVEIVLAIEGELDIVFEDDELLSLNTVKNVVDLIDSKRL